jgi:hypothetical protein
VDSEIPTLDDRVSRNYNDFFPNIGISYNDQKNNVISANIGRRITRPDYQFLNNQAERTPVKERQSVSYSQLHNQLSGFMVI